MSKLIVDLTEIEGKTILRAVKQKSSDGEVNVVQLAFTDGAYCILVSDNPAIEVNLMDDSEHIVPSQTTLPGL
jgi:hypothetical protein